MKKMTYEELKIAFPEKYKLLILWYRMKVIENRTKGRIKRCERWNDFETFFADMFPSYTSGASLRRKVSMNGYSPENCYWKEKKDRVFITVLGRNVSLYEASKITGESYNTIRNRIADGKQPLNDEQMRLLEKAVMKERNDLMSSFCEGCIHAAECAGSARRFEDVSLICFWKEEKQDDSKRGDD